MKKLLIVFLIMLFSAFAPTASAQCTTPPIMTGSVGSQSQYAPNPDYVTYWTIANPYTFNIQTSFSGNVPISFGAGSGVTIRTGTSCAISTGEVTPGTGDCTNGYVPEVVTPSTGPYADRIRSVWLRNQASPFRAVLVIINGVKRFEVVGVNSYGPLANGVANWDEGLSVIKQRTVANSSLDFAGFVSRPNGADSVWTSTSVTFASACRAQ